MNVLRMAEYSPVSSLGYGNLTELYLEYVNKISCPPFSPPFLQLTVHPWVFSWWTTCPVVQKGEEETLKSLLFLRFERLYIIACPRYPPWCSQDTEVAQAQEFHNADGSADQSVWRMEKIRLHFSVTRMGCLGTFAIIWRAWCYAQLALFMLTLLHAPLTKFSH